METINNEYSKYEIAQILIENGLDIDLAISKANNNIKNELIKYKEALINKNNNK